MFSDNYSDVFEWNWLILGILIDLYVRCCAQSKNSNSDLLIVKYSYILKYTNPSPYYFFLIICPMYSYVLYYNIEKSGFNAVSTYLLLWIWLQLKVSLKWFLFSFFFYRLLLIMFVITVKTRIMRGRDHEDLTVSYW